MELNDLQQHDAEQLTEREWLIGIDEAGRGALAGPVVAGACVLGQSFFRSAEAVALSAEVNDSKQLSAGARESYFGQIKALQRAGLLDFTVASASVAEIAERNILGATRLAMQRAVEALVGRTSSWKLPEAAADGPLFAGEATVQLIVDGRPLKPFPYAHRGIVKGDGKSLSIAMASIAAKVSRDRELVRLATDYPDYGFDGHKGYATRSHRQAILTHGASPVHRELFLRKILMPKASA
ncbi:ribonuclease HII [Coraliomargarita sinensis]|uniref:Ribonuclease n=1 Tax=Coraliomargarita sinensis TaxID=2174842 RepID=A0A317ZHM7_9BACT|nr:ribonuclease HII [Coraliomargarita sinensis]PXA03478.1 ribonuclease HII [Coraliomargarita sinensis]